METITQSRIIKALNVCFTTMWYMAVVGAIIVVLNFWYVPLKTGGEKLPYLENTVELVAQVQEFTSTVKAGNVSEAVLRPKLIEANAKIRLTSWSDILQVKVVMYLALVSLSIGLGLSFIYQFHKIFKSLRAGHVFQSVIIKRVRYIGLILLFAPFVDGLSKLMYNQFVLNQIDISGFKVNTSMTIGITSDLIMGFVVLALAEVFKVGLQLQQEKELTI